jgi:hypothetical protein
MATSAYALRKGRTEALTSALLEATVNFSRNMGPGDDDRSARRCSTGFIVAGAAVDRGRMLRVGLVAVHPVEAVVAALQADGESGSDPSPESIETTQNLDT